MLPKAVLRPVSWLITCSCFLGWRPTVAAEWQHFGAPPVGTVLAELVSEISVTPMQLAGTTDPPTVLLNGKMLSLQEDPMAQGLAAQTLVVNAVDRPVTGKAGRFFVQLGAAEASVPALDVLLTNREARAYRARVQLNRIFLDAPFEARKYLPEGVASRPKLPLEVEGQLPLGFELGLDEGRVEREGDSRVVLRLELSPGQSVISARLKPSEGAERVINVPVQVKKSTFDPDAPILSLEVPEGWAVQPGETRIRGMTNPGAKVELDGQPVHVTERGAFELILNQNEEKRFEPKIQIRLASGKSMVYRPKVFCPECGVEETWYRPRFRKKGASGNRVGSVRNGVKPQGA